MYIGEIQLKNIRGFGSKKLRVDLDLRRPNGRYAGWTVIAGRNGSGKSTLLKAVALAVVGPSRCNVLQQSFAGWIREGQRSATVATKLLFDEKDIFTGSKSWDNEEGKRPSRPLGANLLWDSSETIGQEPIISYRPNYTEPHDSYSMVTEDIDDPLFTGPWAQDLPGWFVVGYGPWRRLSSQSLDSHLQTRGPLQITRLANLFREDVSLIESIQWLRELHLRRLERRKGAEALLDGVLTLLNDSLLPESTRIEKVDSEGLWVTQRGVSLPLRDMSDGYRTVVALVMDLTRQLYAAYGEFLPVLRDGAWCVPYSGVVLIDEVELHLHLAWQRRIGFWFKNHFPNIQFIVTTHSPFVCQAADPNGLIRLPAPGEDRAAEHVSKELYKTVVNGTVDEAVLTELFGLEHVHSDKSEQLRERVAQLEGRVLEGEATTGEREELERLSEQLPDTGSAIVERAMRKFGLDK